MTSREQVVGEDSPGKIEAGGVDKLQKERYECMGKVGQWKLPQGHLSGWS